jgi:hypothetical protein
LQILTLTRPDNRGLGALAKDEQLHVLPHYAAEDTDEFGGPEGVRQMVRDGGLEILKK